MSCTNSKLEFKHLDRTKIRKRYKKVFVSAIDKSSRCTGELKGLTTHH